MNIFYCQGCSEIRAASTSVGKYKCRKCGGDVINLHIREEAWDRRSNAEKRAIIREKQNINKMVLTIEEELDKETFDFNDVRDKNNSDGPQATGTSASFNKKNQFEVKHKAGFEQKGFPDFDEEHKHLPSQEDDEDVDLSAFGIPSYTSFSNGSETSSSNLGDKGNIFEDVLDDITRVSRGSVDTNISRYSPRDKDIDLLDIYMKEAESEGSSGTLDDSYSKREPKSVDSTSKVKSKSILAIVLIIIGFVIYAEGIVVVLMRGLDSFNLEMAVITAANAIAGSLFLVGGIIVKRFQRIADRIG